MQVIVQDGEVQGVYLDRANAELLVDIIEGLAKGTCRLVKNNNEVRL
jgi:hypothetical protein